MALHFAAMGQKQELAAQRALSIHKGSAFKAKTAQAGTQCTRRDCSCSTSSHSNYSETSNRHQAVTVNLHSKLDATVLTRC